MLPCFNASLHVHVHYMYVSPSPSPSVPPRASHQQTTAKKASPLFRPHTHVLGETSLPDLTHFQLFG